MTEELREKIAQVLELYYTSRQTWQGVGQTPEDVAADQILDLIEQEGYVKLAKNQKLPLCRLASSERVQREMLNAGWRKVEMEVDKQGKNI